MYLLYLDDSGSVPNLSESHFVLGGVCVFERRLKWLNKRLNDLAKEIQPNAPNEVEFHASEIFSGRKPPWKTMRREERIETIKAVLNTLDDEPDSSVILACAIHKASCTGGNIVETAFEDLISRFDMFLNRIYHEKKEAHRGLIVCDESAYENTLQKLATDFRRLGTRWGATIKNIDEVPLFVDSKASRLIQLADHVAYAVFRRYSGEDLSYFNLIESRFDKSEGVIHGLAHKQWYKDACTCPACLTRH